MPRTIFSETFDGTINTPLSLMGWRLVYGRVGALLLDGAGKVKQADADIVGSESIFSYPIIPPATKTITATIVAGTRDQWVGVLANVFSDDTHYNLRLQAGTLYLYAITPEAGSGYALLGSAAVTVADGGSYTIVWRVSVSGTTVTHSVDFASSTNIIAATDSYIPAPGPVGIWFYCNTASGTQRYLSAVSVTDPAADASPAAPAQITAEFDAGDNVIVAWSGLGTPISYVLERSIDAGATWSTVYAGLETACTDTLPPGNSRYRVSTHVAAGTGPASIVVIPTLYQEEDYSSLATSAVSPTVRLPVLTDGERRLAALPQNLNFVSRNSQLLGGACVGPLLFDDGFTAPVPIGWEVLPGGPTGVYGSGKLSVSGNANYYVLRHPARWVGPVGGIEVRITSATAAKVGIGLGRSGAEGVFLRWSSADNKFYLYGYDGATLTDIIAEFVPSSPPAMPFTLRMEFAHTVYTIWINTGDGWRFVGKGAGGDDNLYDLRLSGRLRSWSPIVFFTGDSTYSASISHVKADYGFGSGGGRELQWVTLTDGSAYRRADGMAWLGADRSGPAVDPGANVANPITHAMHPYDPQTKRILPPDVVLFGVDNDGRTIATQDTKVCYDPNDGTFHVWWNDWSSGKDSDLNGPPDRKLYYANVAAALFSGPVLLDSVIVSLPTGVDSGLYGTDWIKRNGVWYGVGTQWLGDSSWPQKIVSGVDPAAPNVLSSTIADNLEGLCWLPLANRLYLLAGQISGTNVKNYGGLIKIFDVTNPAAPTLVSRLSYRSNHPGTSELPQQPTAVWIGDKLHLATNSGLYFDAYANPAYVDIDVSDLSLVGWEFPERASYGQGEQLTSEQITAAVLAGSQQQFLLQGPSLSTASDIEADTSVQFDQQFTRTGLVITGWQRLAFILKRSPATDDDSAAMLYVVKSNPAATGTDGLQIFKGTPVETTDSIRAMATIAVLQSSPDSIVSVAFEATVMNLEPSNEGDDYAYEIDYWDSAGKKRRFGRGALKLNASVLDRIALA